MVLRNVLGYFLQVNWNAFTVLPFHNRPTLYHSGQLIYSRGFIPVIIQSHNPDISSICQRFWYILSEDELLTSIGKRPFVRLGRLSTSNFFLQLVSKHATLFHFIYYTLLKKTCCCVQNFVSLNCRTHSVHYSEACDQKSAQTRLIIRASANAYS